jgi:beta-glucosidase
MKSIKLKISTCFLIISLGAFSQNTETAESILAKMTPEQKISQLYGVDNYSTFSIQSITKKALTGKSKVLKIGKAAESIITPLAISDGHKGSYTNGDWILFPPTLTRAASFDPELEYKVGKVFSAQAQAAGANIFLGGTNNLLRNPRTGRAEESYGEDTYLTGAMGVQLVKGVQEGNHVMATVKHFAMYSIEDNRYNANINADERTMMEVFLPHFKKLIQEGNAASVMSAYNKVNGEYCGQNKYLLTDILRTDWGFKGFVQSDWTYGVYNTTKAVKAGLNIEMASMRYYSKDSIIAAINRKEITWNDIDNLVLPILKMKLQYGKNEAHILDKKTVQEQRSLAREVAEKSLVMLKNDNILPLSIRTIKNILVVGELGKFNNMGDIVYLCDNPQLKAVTPFQGLKNYLKGSGCELNFTDGKNRVEFRKLATKADAVIVCVGYTSADESEDLVNADGLQYHNDKLGGDRENMNLHQLDIDLIRTTPRYCSKSVVVFFGGGTPVVSPWINSTPSLLYAGYYGMEGGNALANILFGKVNPSGKLPYSIFMNEIDYPAFPNNPRKALASWEINEKKWVDPSDINYGYYLGYTLAEKKNLPVSFHFGYGLSYTNFKIDDISTDKKEYTVDDVIKVKYNVSNIGKVKGAEVVQVYVGFENAKVDRPVKALKGFSKVEVDANGSSTVEVSVPVKELAYWDVNSKLWRVEKIAYPIYVGNSSRFEDLQKVDIAVK